jgi:hypothetical protein
MRNQKMEEKDIAPIEIDLGIARRGEIDESFLAMFGGALKYLMGSMFGGASVPVNVKGTKSEISAFSKALSREKSYIKTAAKHGLDNPRTYKDKFKLRKAVDAFQRKTGLKWPFKG